MDYTPHKPEHLTKMNSEPERCRRTDGRKWRCSKNVVLNQKYCEGHMHRGRQRSRKLVEPDGKIISKTVINNSSIKTPSQKSLSFGSLTAIPVKTDVVQSQPCKNRDLAGGKVSGYKNANPGAVGNGKKHGMEKINCLVPKSVFGAGHAKPSQKSVTECGPQRCRRTVGRKQLCTRDSLPDSNYCEIHGLKGAKRVISGSQQPTSNKVQATLTRAMTKSVDKTINLNRPPFGPHVIVGNNSTGSSSDATTVTDERIGFFVLDYLSDC